MTVNRSPLSSNADDVSTRLEGAKLAHVANVLDQQNALLGELHSAYKEKAKLAAALCQAVKLAEDGVIDVSDVVDTARRLVTDGSVKMSAVDAAYEQTPGTLVQPTAQAAGQMDPLTALLRGSWNGPAA